jgi:lactoylglutathione lyase
MFSHVFIGVTDFERALNFYRPLMACLGHTEKFCDLERPWAGWHNSGDERPLLVISKPFDQQPHKVGNGQMTAFISQTRDVVDLAYRIALSSGGASEGAPGLREEYHDSYYGAYFRDPDGNKLCVVCHLPEGM